MEYTFTTKDNIGIYELSGSLIGENDGMPLYNSFNEQTEEGTRKFILDLTNLKHVNSTGLGVFITLLTRARKQDGELVLLKPSGYIKNLMLITKLNTIFKIFETLPEAKAALSE